MVESVSQLREVCQKPNYRQVGNWMARHVTRDMALYVTWLVLHTRLRSDSVVLIGLACGFGSAILLSIPTAMAFFAGALFLQLWYLLDHVDGQVARYYGEADLTGTFFDFMCHFFVHSSVVFGLGVRMFFQTGWTLWIGIGFLTALAMGGLTQFHDCKYKAFFARLAQWQGKVVQLGSGTGIKDTTPPVVPAEKTPWAKILFAFFYKLTEIHVFMNLLGLAAIAELAGWPGAKTFIYGYAVLLPCVLILRMIHAIRTHRIDADFEKQFSLVDSQ